MFPRLVELEETNNFIVGPSATLLYRHVSTSLHSGPGNYVCMSFCGPRNANAGLSFHAKCLKNVKLIII